MTRTLPIAGTARPRLRANETMQVSGMRAPHSFRNAPNCAGLSAPWGTFPGMAGARGQDDGSEWGEPWRRTVALNHVRCRASNRADSRAGFRLRPDRAALCG